MMSSVAIVLLYGYCVRFAGYMPFFWKYLSKSIPVISIESAIIHKLDFVIEAYESCSITISGHPGHSPPCTTIQRFDNPTFVFLIRYNATFRQTPFQ
jgi:hypothetical protein